MKRAGALLVLMMSSPLSLFAMQRVSDNEQDYQTIDDAPHSKKMLSPIEDAQRLPTCVDRKNPKEQYQHAHKSGQPALRTVNWTRLKWFCLVLGVACIADYFYVRIKSRRAAG